jgi:pilus assembly protein CpaE
VEKFAVLLVGMRPEAEERLASSLGQQQLVRSVSDAAGVRLALQKARPASAVVAVGHGLTPELGDVIRELTAGGTSVIAVGAAKDPDLILASMRAGAKEYLVTGDADELERKVQQFLETTGALRLGRVTAVFPAKGGMGGTTLATNLAGAFHGQAKRVCLADVDEFGDASSFLDVKCTYSVADVASNSRRLDRELLDSSVPRHGSGIWVLSQGDKVGEGVKLDAAGLSGVLRFLRSQYDEVVLDGIRDFGDLALAALDMSDRILLVVTQEVPAVRNAQRCAELFQRLGYAHDRITLIVNRYQKASSITRAVIEETVGLPIAAVVGNDFHAVTQAVNRGVLVAEAAPRSIVAKDVEVLASLLSPRAAEATANIPFLKKLLSPRLVLHGAQ